MIRRGGSCRNGKLPDRIIDAIFVRFSNEDGRFEFLYPGDELRRISVGYVDDIIAVNDEPILSKSRVE